MDDHNDNDGLVWLNMAKIGFDKWPNGLSIGRSGNCRLRKMYCNMPGISILILMCVTNVHPIPSVQFGTLLFFTGLTVY